MNLADHAPKYLRRRTHFTTMNKQIQVDLELFHDLSIYAFRHADPGDLIYERIRAGIRRKADAMKRHAAYTAYKIGKNPETRQQGRDIYLEFIGLADDFRWPVKQDYNVSRTGAFSHPP